FWQSLQDLAVNPEDAGARSVVAQRALAVSDTFNYLSDSLSSIRTDLRKQIDVEVKDANSLIRQINAINEQVKNVETNGQLPNDLYDERDRLIDELSGIVNIDVRYTKSSDGALDIADGLATIKLADENGNPVDAPVLVSGDIANGELGFNEITVSYTGNGYEPIDEISVNGESLTLSGLASTGSLKGLVESYGYSENGETKGIYPEMLNDLDTMAQAFAKAFNDIHNDGADLNGNQGIEDFFQNASGQEAAGNMTVNEAILDDP